MPYSDPDKQKKAMRKIMREYRERKKPELLKRKQDSLYIQREQLRTIMMDVYDSWIDFPQLLEEKRESHRNREEYYRNLERELNRDRESWQSKFSFETKISLTERDKQLFNELKHLYPFMTSKEITEDIIFYSGFSAKSLYRAAQKATHSQVARKLHLFMEEQEEAWRELRKTMPEHKLMRPFTATLSSTKRLELLTDCMKHLHDQGFSYKASEQTCYYKISAEEKDWKQLNNERFMQKWTFNEKGTIDEIHRLENYDIEHMNRKAEERAAFLRACRVWRRESLTENQVVAKIVESFGEEEKGYWLAYYRVFQKDREENTLKMEVDKPKQTRTLKVKLE